jgi:hypothetical protein
MADTNRFVILLLQELDRYPLSEIGRRTEEFLVAQTADARLWPTDDELREQLPATRAYGSIKQQRLRMVLAAVERRSRTERNEDVSLPPRLDIEHVMPQGWRAHWDSDGASTDPRRENRRDLLVNTLGNLTLVTQKLNVALSNRPWRDDEAAVVAPTGKDAGKGKRSLLDRFSILVLNKDIVQPHPEGWTEQDIIDRSGRLAEAIIDIWRRPVGGDD